MCLPDEIVAALGLATRLRALTKPALAPMPLQCIYRRPLGDGGLVARIAETLRNPDASTLLDAPA